MCAIQQLMASQSHTIDKRGKGDWKRQYAHLGRVTLLNSLSNKRALHAIHVVNFKWPVGLLGVPLLQSSIKPQGDLPGAANSGSGPKKFCRNPARETLS